MTKKPEQTSSQIRVRQATEEKNLFSRLPAIYAASRAQGQRILRQAGDLSIVEWRTLWDLVELGPMSIKDLAEIQRTDHSLLSRALPAMKKKGYVTTRRDDCDGRQMVVEVKEAGRLAYEQAAPFMGARRAALAQQFSPEELDRFVTYLNRLEGFLRTPIETILEQENKND